MSKLLRPVVVVASLAALVGLSAGCTIASIDAPTLLGVGQSAELRVLDTRGLSVTNSDLCGVSVWPTGIISLGPLDKGRATRTVTGVAPGLAKVEFDCGANERSVRVRVARGLESVTVTPTASVADGLSAELTATAQFADGTTQDVTSLATWTTADPDVADWGGYAPAPGKVSGASPGQTTYTATFREYPGGPVRSGTGTVTVGPAVVVAVTISPQFLLGIGAVYRYDAAAVYSDGTTRSVRDEADWSSSDPVQHPIGNGADDKGLYFANNFGIFTVTVEYGGHSASIEVIVRA